MTSIDVISNGRRFSIEVCEVWDFVRDIHTYQAHVVDKEAMQRYIIGKFKTSKTAEQKAKKRIKNQFWD